MPLLIYSDFCDGKTICNITNNYPFNHICKVNKTPSILPVIYRRSNDLSPFSYSN